MRWRIDKDCKGISRGGWQKDLRYMEGLRGNVNYGLYLAHYNAYSHIKDDVKKSRFLSVTNKFLLSRNSFRVLLNEQL